MRMEFLAELLDLILSPWRRLYACLLMALAISAFILLLVPARTLSIVLSIVVIATGVIGGVWWERASS